MDYTRVGLEFDVSFSSHIYFESVVPFALSSLINDYLYDHKIAFWNYPTQFRGTFCLICLVTIQCIYILCQWLDIEHLEGIRILLCNYTTSILWHLCWYNFFVVRFYHARHVLCARIASLYSVSVENCVKIVRFWKVLIYHIQKSFSYVGGNFVIKRWIKPDDVTGAISFLFYVFFVCINEANVFVSTFLWNFFIFTFWHIKNLLVWRNIWWTIAYRYW